MEAPDLKKYAQEVNEMPALASIAVEIPPLAALAIISHIQLAIRHPGIADSEFAQIAIDVAKQLQNLFGQDSETYKVLELGWNPEADILTPSGELEEGFSHDRRVEFKKAIKNYFQNEGIDLDEVENSEVDILRQSEELGDEFCEEPCDKFLQNLGCRCTGNRVAEPVADDEQIPPQTLAAGAAIMHQFAQSLESEGFELLDI